MAQIRYFNGSVFELKKDEFAVEISESWYYDFMGCVPPIWMPGGGFQVGEPTCSDNEGVLLYTPIIEHNGHCYAVRPQRKGFTYSEALNEVHKEYLRLNRK